MGPVMLPAPRDIQKAVEEEVTRIGGKVQDCLADNRRLFLRSVLPFADEVRPKDRVQGGVAVMAANQDIWVHPYTYREVCRNGAIMTHTVESHKVERVEPDSPADVVEEVLAEVRNVVRQCSTPDVFSNVASRLRSAAQIQASLVIDLMSFLSRLPQDQAFSIVSQVIEHFASDGDDSVFGLMNAVTRTARDEPDPEVRWDLEELGGGVLAMVRPVRRPSGAAADLVAVNP